MGRFRSTMDACKPQTVSALAEKAVAESLKASNSVAATLSKIQDDSVKIKEIASDFLTACESDDGIAAYNALIRICNGDGTLGVVKK